MPSVKNCKKEKEPPPPALCPLHRTPASAPYWVALLTFSLACLSSRWQLTLRRQRRVLSTVHQRPPLIRSRSLRFRMLSSLLGGKSPSAASAVHPSPYTTIRPLFGHVSYVSQCVPSFPVASHNRPPAPCPFHRTLASAPCAVTFLTFCNAFLLAWWLVTCRR